MSLNITIIKPRILVNNKILEDCYIFGDKDDLNFYLLQSKSNEILQATISDFIYAVQKSVSEDLAVFNLKIIYDLEKVGFIKDIEIFVNESVANVEISIKPNLANWTEKFSFGEYIEKFVKQLELFNIYWNLADADTLDKGIIVHTKIDYLDSSVEFTIKQVLDSEINDLRICHENTLKILETEVSSKEFILHFNFPEVLKAPCEQYLLYFAQFLRDLGINTTSNLKEEAGKVLFSVTPTDDKIALDKIREALAIYLSLPSNPIPNSTGDRTVDMVLSGARANAKHLESQLELAIAKLQFKDATLELKDATIEQQQLSLRQKDETIKDLQEIVSRGNIFEESLERIEINGEIVDINSLYRFSREDDIEVEVTPISDENKDETKVGLVKFHEVTKLKEYGVSFDLAKAIRGLIDYFKREK